MLPCLIVFTNAFVCEQSHLRVQHSHGGKIKKAARRESGRALIFADFSFNPRNCRKKTSQLIFCLSVISLENFHFFHNNMQAIWCLLLIKIRQSLKESKLIMPSKETNLFPSNLASAMWKIYRDQSRLTFLLPLHQTPPHLITSLSAAYKCAGY